MRRRPKASVRVALLTVFALVALPLQAAAQTQTPGKDPVLAASPNIFSMGFDAVILRPFGFAVLAVGSAMFVPVAIVTAPGGKDNLEGALEFFVLNPYRDVFERPLGEF